MDEGPISKPPPMMMDRLQAPDGLHFLSRMSSNNLRAKRPGNFENTSDKTERDIYSASNLEDLPESPSREGEVPSTGRF